MVNFFTNKKIWKMLIIVMLTIMTIQILAPTTVVFAAETDDSDAAQKGDNIVSRGILMRPLMSLLVSVGDGIISVLHSQVMGQENSLLPFDLGEDPGLIGILIGIAVGLVAAVVVVALIATGLAAIGAVIAAIGAEVAVASIGAGTIIFGAAVGGMVGFAVYNQFLPETLYLPAYTYSAEEIFKGNILLFNVNFFDTKDKELYVSISDPKDESKVIKMSVSDYKNYLKTAKDPVTVKGYFYYYNNIKDEAHEVPTSPQDSAVFLRKTIATWYVTIRNICIVCMLSILIYIGIRMMLSSVANDKAKYKQMIKDWVVGLCLLFVMHYIMAFSVTMVEKLTQIVKTSVDKGLYMAIIEDKDKKIENELKDTALKEYMKDGYLYYPTNLMGYLRIEMQKQDDNGAYIGMIVCFLILVIFTCMFSITYLRRLLYMAFLTIIAPLVALTYPIDKVTDGQAQGFNTWIKEYLFNLLIQPMHLMLYFILVTSAVELAGRNVIYSLVALGFMLPAEKLLRRMFGFEKAKTPPLLGGPLGASLMMQGINSLSRIARGGKSPNRGGGNGKELDDKKAPINFADSADEMGTIAAGIPDDTPEIEGESGSGIEIPGEEEPLDIGGRSEEPSPIVMAGHKPLDIGGPSEGPSPIEIAGRERPLDLGDAGAEPSSLETTEHRSLDTGDRSEESSKHKPTKRELKKMERKRLRQAAASGVRVYGKTALRNAPRNIKGAVYKGVTGTIKRVPGAAVGVATTAALGTLAGAATIASGDPKNIVTAAGAVTGAGYAAGSRMTNSMTTTNLNESTKAAIRAANEKYNGEEWKEHEQEKQYQEHLHDPENEEKIKNEIIDPIKTEGKTKGETKEEIKEKQDRAQEEFEENYRQMVNYGVTDMNRAIALHQGIKEGDFKNVDDAVAHSQLYDRFGQQDPERMGAKDRENFDKTMVRGLISASGGRVTEEKARDESKVSATKLHKLHGRLHH